MESLSIYIHWPFCEKKCPYCDFFSQVKKADEDKIIDSYIKDLDFYHNITNKRKIKSVFFGGGTPSLLKSTSIEKLLNHIHKKWSVADDIEITLEANPNSLKAKDIKQAGINRLSIGIQALNDADLQFLGRIHNTKEALQAIEQASKTFDNFSIDMIYARPGQALKDWQKELDIINNFNLKHMSLYQLMIEEGTPFYKQGVEALEDDLAVNMYNFTRDYINIPQYEISNFAQEGFESKHNLAYWQGEDYLGIGKTAHGRITTKDKRIATTHPLQLEELTPQERATELLIMGLRIKDGIDKSRFFKHSSIKFDNFINQKNKKQLEKTGFIIDTKESLKATPQGFPVLNKIIDELSD